MRNQERRIELSECLYGMGHINESKGEAFS